MTSPCTFLPPRPTARISKRTASGWIATSPSRSGSRTDSPSRRIAPDTASSSTGQGWRPAGHKSQSRSGSRRAARPPSSTKRSFEVPPGDGIEPASKLPIPRHEILPGLGQVHSASWPAPLDALDKLEAGRAFELPQISPRVTVRHARHLRRRPQGAPLFDQLEQVGPAVSELETVTKGDPHLELRLHGSPMIRNLAPVSQTAPGRRGGIGRVRLRPEERWRIEPRRGIVTQPTVPGRAHGGRGDLHGLIGGTRDEPGPANPGEGRSLSHRPGGDES